MNRARQDNLYGKTGNRAATVRSGSPVASVAMVLTMAAKEVLERMQGARYLLVTIICVAVFGLNAVGLKARHLSECRDYDLAFSQYSTVLTDNTPFKFYPFTMRRPPAVSALFGSPMSPTDTRTRTSEQPLRALFCRLNYTRAAALLLSLLALILSFDAISSEREAGTLKLLLAGCAPKAQILLAKLIGMMCLISIPFLLSVAVGVLVVYADGSSTLRLPDCVALAAFTVSCLAYVAVFACLGLASSVCFRSSETSMVVSLLLWVVLALVVPNGAPAIASAWRPAPSVWETARHRIELLEALSKERDAALDRYLQEHPDRDRLSWLIDDLLGGRFARPLLESEFTADSVQSVALTAQMGFGYTLARVSPYASMTHVAQTLSQTGAVEFRECSRQIREYQHQCAAATCAAIKRDFSGTPGAGGGWPVFHYQPSSLEGRLLWCLADFGLLVGWAVLFYMAAYGLLVRKREA